MRKVRNGSILISEPYLGDPNFERTVVLVCRHSPEGTFGLVLNRPGTLKLSDVLTFPDTSFDTALGIGGPMQTNTLHYLHQIPDLNESIKLTQNLYWGGDFEQLQEFMTQGRLNPFNIRFFLGYSGWGKGQLEEEVSKNVWIVNNKAADKLFNLDTNTLWRQILKDMGGKYKMFSNYPVDPGLN
jgi:putative transcriptional regulator